MTDYRISQLGKVPSKDLIEDTDLFIINNTQSNGTQITKSVSKETLQEIFGGTGSTIEPIVIDKLNEANKWALTTTVAWGDRGPQSIGNINIPTVNVGAAKACLIAWSTSSQIKPRAEVINGLTEEEKNYPYTNRGYFAHTIKVTGGTWTGGSSGDSLAISTKHTVTIRPNKAQNIPKFHSRIPVHKIGILSVTDPSGNLVFNISGSVDGAGFCEAESYPGRIIILPIDTVPTSVASVLGDSDVFSSSQYASAVEYQTATTSSDELVTQNDIDENTVANIYYATESYLSRLGHQKNYYSYKGISDSSAIDAAIHAFYDLRDISKTPTFDDLKTKYAAAAALADAVSATYPQPTS